MVNGKDTTEQQSFCFSLVLTGDNRALGSMPKALKVDRLRDLTMAGGTPTLAGCGAE
jgi:hypothetical protein